MKGCKNCPAYAKCTVIYRGSACAALRGTYGLDNDPEIITNADRIRAMSDEELAKWFLTVGICIRDFEDCKCDGVSCRQCRMNWLQQPAEEDIP